MLLPWGRNLVLSGGAGLKLICPGYQGGGTWARCCGVAPLMASDGIEQHVVGVPWDEFCSNPPLRYLLKHLKCFQLSLNVCSQELLCLEVVTSSRNSHWWCKITWQHLWENNYIGKRLFWDFFFCRIWRITKSGEVQNSVVTPPPNISHFFFFFFKINASAFKWVSPCLKAVTPKCSYLGQE